MTKALSYDEIEKRIRDHGFELITTRTGWESRERHHCEHLNVRLGGGYEQIRRVDTFARSAMRAICQYDLLARKGQTLAMMSASALLGVPLMREFTPSMLKPYGLRLDRWAELQAPVGDTVFFALEHQGDHRKNPLAPLQHLRDGAEVSMRDQARRDRLKFDQLAHDQRVVLVTIPDLLVTTSLESKMIGIVADRLEARVGCHGWPQHAKTTRRDFDDAS